MVRASLGVSNILHTTKKQSRARALLIFDHKILLIQDAVNIRKRWGLPGGGIEYNETAAEATAREIREELSIDIPAEEYHELGTYDHRSIKQRFDTTFFYHVISYPERHHVKPTHEIYDAKWFRLDSLPKNRKSFIDVIVSDYQNR